VRRSYSDIAANGARSGVTYLPDPDFSPKDGEILTTIPKIISTIMVLRVSPASIPTNINP
jgi:hypothetical protein